MQLRTLPSYFRSDQSPMSATDSPFPPLKTQHRYKGVYERAGFDVNVNGGPSDYKSIYLKKSSSATSPTFSTASGKPASAKNYNASSRSLPQLSHKHARPAPSYDDLRDPRSSPLSSSHTRLAHPAPFVQKPFSLGPHSAPASAVSPSPNSDFPQQFEVPRRGSNQDRKHPPQPQFQPFQPFVPLGRNGSISKTDDRNIKNLSLHIPDSNFSSGSTPNQTSADSFSASSPTFDHSAHYKRLTPPTMASSYERKNSASSGISVKTSELAHAPYPVHDTLNTSDRDLTDVLGEFRAEVEEHKKYDPRSRGPRQVETYNEDLEYFHQKHQLGVDDFNDSSQDDSSFRFNSARQSNETDDTTQDDFQELLVSSAKRGDSARHSQLSTISSIISKPLHSDDEDAEVERELERQLESLKTGSDLSLTSFKNSKEDESFVTALNSLSDFDQRQVPSFRIDSVSQISEEESSESDAETDRGSNHSVDLNEEETTEDFDQVAPLNFQKRTQAPEIRVAPETPEIPSNGFRDVVDTPETIRPLSPKNHRVEEELHNIKFTGASTPKFVDGNLGKFVSQADDDFENEDDILRQNPTPSEFEAFPKSVVGMDIPNFRTSTVGPKCGPGEGPCRGCSEEVEPNARGGQKAIYSRNAELSGQWHRACFSCAYVGCDVKFNKQTTCYVLLDNAFCYNHYHSLNGTRCQSCHQGIEGECIENELKQKWHVHCLACSHCHSQIKSDYYLINNAIYCENDALNHINSMKRNGLSTNDKIEKRRTRMLFLEQQHGM